MCGRYYVDDETAKEIERIVRQVNDKLIVEHRAKQGATDVYPTEKAPVIWSKENELVVSDHTWGFPHFDKKGVIFNARSETAFDKPMFRDSIKERRCIIPATGFYEWNKNKDKFYFQAPDKKVLLFAGFYKKYQDGNRFVIITTEANESMKSVHSRMPLILNPEEVNPFIYDNEKAAMLLKKEPKALNKQIMGQMALDLSQ